MSGRVRSEIIRLVRERALSQHGLITRKQAIEVGLSSRAVDRRLEFGEWVRIFPGIYRIAGSMSPYQDLQATCLWVGARAVVSHRSAANLWGLLGFEAMIVEITTDRPRTPPSSEVILHHAGLMPAQDLARIRGFTVTSVARTLIDLGAVVGEEQVEIALDDALSRGLVSMAALEKRVVDFARRGRRGVAVARELLTARAGGQVTKSILETKLVRVIRKGRLPEPLRQFEVLLPNGRLALIDLAYPESMLAIEADSFKFHGGKRILQHDVTRRNLLTLLGWTVVSFTWDDVVKRPDYVVSTIRQFLSALATNRVGTAHKNG